MLHTLCILHLHVLHLPSPIPAIPLFFFFFSFICQSSDLFVFFLLFSFLFLPSAVMSNLPNLTQNKRLVPPKGLSVHGSSHVVDMFPLSPDQTRPDQTRPNQTKPKPSCARSRSPGNSTIHILCTVVYRQPPNHASPVTHHPSPITSIIWNSPASHLPSRLGQVRLLFSYTYSNAAWLAG